MNPFSHRDVIRALKGKKKGGPPEPPSDFDTALLIVACIIAVAVLFWFSNAS